MCVPKFILPCSTFPTISWWRAYQRNIENVCVHTGISFSEWEAPNRYKIASASGPLLLSVPLSGGRRTKIDLTDARIDFTHDWRRRHWRGIQSAYGKTPFFKHYEQELGAIIFGDFISLKDFNIAGIEFLCRSFKIKKPLLANVVRDFENTIIHNPKAYIISKKYYQVFAERIGFLPELSALDLLLNEGPAGLQFLQSL